MTEFVGVFGSVAAGLGISVFIAMKRARSEYVSRHFRLARLACAGLTAAAVVNLAHVRGWI